MSDWKPACMVPSARLPTVVRPVTDPEPSRGLVTQAMLAAQAALDDPAVQVKSAAQRIADAILAAVASRNAVAAKSPPGRPCREAAVCIRSDCRFLHATPPNAAAVLKIAEGLAARSCAANASACRNGLACTFLKCTYAHDTAGASADAKPKSKSPLLTMLGVQPESEFDPDSVMPDGVGDDDCNTDDEEYDGEVKRLHRYTASLEEAYDCAVFNNTIQAEKIAELEAKNAALEAKVAKLETELLNARACNAPAYVPYAYAPPAFAPPAFAPPAFAPPAFAPPAFAPPAFAPSAFAPSAFAPTMPRSK
jgi:hypothetical protein